MTSSARVVGERGVVLHTRPYRETSVIASILTAEHGRIAAVAKGARGRRRGNELQPFNQITMNWSGRGSLVNLTAFEGASQPWLKGDSMAGAFYVVELVTRLLVERESAPRVFAATVWALDSLALGSPTIEVVLRSFEKLLLEELGYGVDFRRDAQSGERLDANGHYALVEERGFVPTQAGEQGYAGADLLCIADENYASGSARRAAKRIFRRLLNAHLGPRPLMSRRLLLRGTR